VIFSSLAACAGRFNVVVTMDANIYVPHPVYYSVNQFLADAEIYTRNSTRYNYDSVSEASSCGEFYALFFL